ncbi:hypothetical protein [Crateriforma spongiae]|uniref:hypothetical protein n=1 Tax=Crateriforma spongiae TaxID=2724528 RepID=UPI001445F8E3|nr:hypothetical protein [Crateriforma spongiae]
MQRIESLRDDYLPAFKQLANDCDRPIQAACEISYGGGQQRPGDVEQWPKKIDALLQGQPPLSGRIFWNATDTGAAPITRWLELAGETSKLLGDWVKPLGLDPRAVRPRWAGCWFTLFRELHRIELFPFPVKVTRSFRQSDFILVHRDKRPLIHQVPADLPGKPDLVYGTSELIRIPDLLKATVLAIRCIVDADETRKPREWGAGPAVMVCQWCKRECEADPYCPPWRCIWCGKEYETATVAGEGESENGSEEWTTQLAKLSDRHRHALIAFKLAESAMATPGKKFTRDMAWDWVEEHYEDYPFTGRQAFVDYVTQARGKIGANVNMPRKGRTGRSIAQSSDL